MPQVYSLIFETSVSAPSLSSDIIYQASNTQPLLTTDSSLAESGPMSQKEVQSRQRQERGERRASDIVVESFRHPGDESWADRASSSLVRKSSSKSKESTPARDGQESPEDRKKSKESSPAGASNYSKESLPPTDDQEPVLLEASVNLRNILDVVETKQQIR